MATEFEIKQKAVEAAAVKMDQARAALQSALFHHENAVKRVEEARREENGASCDKSNALTAYEKAERAYRDALGIKEPPKSHTVNPNAIAG